MTYSPSAHGLSTRSAVLIVTVIGLALLHHTDHILRVDHSGWPFRADVSPFTFSLFAYPIALFALFGPKRRFWLRWTLTCLGAVATWAAHSLLESPAMQYSMWAHDHSLDPQAGSVHNLLRTHSPVLGGLAVVISMALNLALAALVFSMLSDRPRGSASATGQSV